jgi:predicted amidophosphoribosyltransferase
VEARDLARATLAALVELVFPPRCAACGAAAGEEPFCPTCDAAVDPVPPGCARCARPGPDALCGACAASPPAFDAVRAGGLFGGPLADAIHAFKYGDRPALARPLGAWLASRAAVGPGAAVVSVPLARGRRVARGYDQAALLADALAQAARARRRRGPVLRRVRETPPAVGWSREERARHVAGAFEASAAVAGEDDLLVDDVVTTGATGDAAAAALRRAGARSVVVVALARAE